MNKLKSFRIVVPTPKSLEEYEKTLAYRCLDKICNADEDIIQIVLDVESNNKRGLSELYQEKLDTCKEDYILFIHDDLEIYDLFLFEKLITAHEIYNIVGLAGAINQTYSRSCPPVWHMCCQGFPQNARGIVSHYIPKNSETSLESHVNSVFFGPTPAKVVAIDGLFMSFKTSVLDKTVPLFDSTYTFHFYDLQMCVNANRKNYSIGVYPIFCIHYGLGHFANDPVWIELANKFLAQNDHYSRSL
jgi:GT2 family glycosyltransferase